MPSLTHIHLVACHFPLLFIPTGFIITLIGLTTRSISSRRIGYGLIVVGALVGTVAFWTGHEIGEGAERDSIIHRHEEAAEKSVLSFAALIIVALGALYSSLTSSQREHRIAFILVIIAALSSVSLGVTGYYGGKVGHPELSER